MTTHPSLARRALARSSRFRPPLQDLERRLCLDCTLSVDKAGTLTILGDDKAHAIAVYGEAAPNGQGSKGAVTVVCDDKARTIPGVNAVAVRTGAGDDSVLVTGLTKTITRLKIDAGDGNNQVNVQGNPFGASESCRIETGDGADTVRFENNFLTAGFTEACRLEIATRGGYDVVTVNDDDFQGATRLGVDTGSGGGAVSLQCDTVHGDLDALFNNTGFLRIGGEEEDGMVMGNTFLGDTRIQVNSGRGGTVFGLQCTMFAGRARVAIDLAGGTNRVDMMGNTFLKDAYLLDNGGKGTDNLTIVNNNFVGDWSLVADRGGGQDPVPTIAANRNSGRVSIRIK